MPLIFRKTAKKLKIVPPVERRISVGGRIMPLTVRQHGQATRITLRIEPGGRALKLTVPPGLAEREIEDFLARHQGWLDTRLSKFATDTALHDGGEVLLRGVPHRIVHTGVLRGLTAAKEIEGYAVLSVSGPGDRIGTRIADFLRKEARADMERLVARHAATIKRPYGTISIKDTRSRWGSCSADGNLSFSWRIAMAPPSVIDYLAAHEVAHLKEMNHGPRFWALCKALCPHMDEARSWLKHNGGMLHAVDFG